MAAERTVSVGGGEGGGRTRRFTGVMGTAVKTYCIVFSAYTILYLAGVFDWLGLFLYPKRHDAVTLAVILSLAFILFPATKNSPRDRVPWYDVIFIIASFVVNFYMVINFLSIIETPRPANTIELVFGTIMVFLILEAIRRAVSWILTVIGALFFLYPFICEYLPAALSSRGFGFERIIGVFYLSSHGVYSSVLTMVTTIIMSFIIFGAFLHATGAGRFFIDVALALVGRFRGGPAKVAVIASGMFGSISGSALANVAATGVVTIPMMKAVGYRPTFAGAVEAVASSGGPIMPPVMGAIIFVMMDLLGATYVEIMAAAIVPAVLYYLACLIMVDLEAARTGLKGVPREQIPPLWPTLRRGWIYAIPFAVLLYFLIALRYSPITSVMYALVSLILVSFLGGRENWATPKKFATALERAPRDLPMVGSAVAMTGLLITSLWLTGIGLKLIGGLVEFSGGNMLVLLSMAAVIAIILGMGIPALASYILLAILLVPGLLMAGLEPMAAHLFVVYFALSHLITPPIGGAFMIAGTIAGASLMRTGWEACRLGIVIYIIPFMFAYSQELLLMGPPLEVLLAVVTALIGVFFLACGVQGYFRRPLGWLPRILILGAALSLITPGWVTDVIGLGAGSVTLLTHELLRRK